MLKRLTILCLLLPILSGSLMAQSPPVTTAAIGYNGITFTYPPDSFGAVLPTYDAGTPYQVDAPYFADIAPHTSFMFLRPDPARPDVDLTGELRVYRIADLEAYGEPSYMEVVNQLRQLDTSDLSMYANAGPDYRIPSLPFLPKLNATQVFRAQPRALNFENVNGIDYYTYFSQSAEPILDGQVMYAYQGITTDGQYYLSFSIYVETGLLQTTPIPQDFDWDTFAANYAGYLQDTFAAINSADAGTFTPTPADLSGFIQSITVQQ